MLQRLAMRRERPPLPVDLIGITPEEYAAVLKTLGYSDRLIQKELDNLARFQAQYAKPAQPRVGPTVTDEQNPMAAALLRRKGRRRTEEKDAETV